MISLASELPTRKPAILGIWIRSLSKAISLFRASPRTVSLPRNKLALMHRLTLYVIPRAFNWESGAHDSFGGNRTCALTTKDKATSFDTPPSKAYPNHSQAMMD